MTCDSPLDFGQAPIGNTKTLIVTCKTNIAITSLNGFATNKPVFQVSNSSLPTGPLALGATFSFPGEPFPKQSYFPLTTRSYNRSEDNTN